MGQIWLDIGSILPKYFIQCGDVTFSQIIGGIKTNLQILQTAKNVFTIGSAYLALFSFIILVLG